MGCRHILGMRVDTISLQRAAELVLGWAKNARSRYVCLANVHMVMEAHDSVQFRDVVNGADLVTPDGMPLAWGLRLLGVPGQERVSGPELMLRVCEAAAAEGVPVGLYGASQGTLEALCDNLQKRFPQIRVTYCYSPPFRPLTPAEDEEITERINASGARILFVGLGCPKQERWMAVHRGRVRAVMLGVGAAFDFHAGRVRKAPVWVQNIGMEWLFRLCMEPRRLWRRYLKHNPRFVALFAAQLIKERMLLRQNKT